MQATEEMQAANAWDDATHASWVRWTVAWSLAASFTYVGYVVLGLVVSLVTPASAATSLGKQYFELLAAGHAPVLYRLAITFDVAAWIALGALLAGFAGVVRRTAP